LRGFDAGAWRLAGRRAESLEVDAFQSRHRRSDGGGAFRVGGLAAGSYRVVVVLPGRSWNAEAGPFEVQGGVVRDGVRVAIDFGRVIAGTLRLPDGSPPAGHITLVALHEAGRQLARVGADGAFRFERLADANYDLSAFRAPPGWALSTVRGIAAGAKDVRLVLERAATISGRVVDAKGQACKAHVTCWTAVGGDESATDTDGRFTIEVPPDYVGRLSAHGDDMAKQVELRDVRAGTRDLVLRLQ
jgi:hypothetical protein